ncbi:hypothetical protein ACFVTC_19890 [Streptomyces sp. NPDC057950]|uniref:hypothetical protein n=1 Tax=Streptomyces sp. NPDC057950 TaxID=3346288 RepID=UPI0036E1C503
MTDAHDHGPRHAHALRLGAFAEAATAVLESPSQCGEAMFEALHECWLALQNVAGHLPPYRDDPREVVERLDEARTQLGRALREASALAAVPHGERPARGATPESGGAEDGHGSGDESREGDGHAAEGRDADEQVGRGDQVASEEGGEAAVGVESVRRERMADPTSHAAVRPEGPTESAAPETTETTDELDQHDQGDQPDPSDHPQSSVPVKQRGSRELTVTKGELTEHRTAAGSPPYGSSSGSPVSPTDPTPDPLADFAVALEQLESDLRSEQVRYLPQPAPPRRDNRGGDAAELVGRIWRRVHMALLRLPGDVATEWRTTAAAEAALAGLPVPDGEVADADVIVLGLPDGLCPAERLPLDFADLPAAAREVDPKFHRYLGLPAAGIGSLPPGDPRPAWAVRAAQAERLAALDPELHVALLHDHQPGSLAEQEHRDKYERRLASLLRTAGQGLDEKMAWTRENRLGAAHHLDMVLGGLVHKRPAAPESWWYQWRTRVSRILIPLAEDANYEVIFRPLEDLRRDFAAEYTIEETVKGVAGSSEPEVQWVVWTALRRKKGSAYGPNKHKGRVVVRPAEPTRR